MPPGLWQSPRRASPGDTQGPVGLNAYWTSEAHVVAAHLRSGPDGLSHAEADRRLRSIGPNRLRDHRSRSRLDVVWAQLRNPLLLILVFAACASALTGEWIDATIVLTIVVASVGIGYSREYSAQAAVAALQAQVQTRTTVVREGHTTSVPIEAVVPGDVVLLSAGTLIPGDGILLDATDCFVNEAVLTGESFPTEKRSGTASETSPLRERSNCVFLGTNVRSGTARCLIVRTGRSTEFGAVAARLNLRPPETEFDRGIRRFGYLMTIAMLVLVLLVFAAHMLRGRPPVETLLFSVALAVGLSPELLPAILSVSLARGAQMMARHGVIVRRLNAIENLGSMNILCTDKTGTLTEGVVQLEGAYDPAGAPSPDVLRLAAWNAALETGLSNPLDEAIVRALQPDTSGLRKVGEIPFDFVRKRVSVIVEDDSGRRVITKGAFERVVDACSRLSGGPLDAAAKDSLTARYEAWTEQGIRVLAVAERALDPESTFRRDDERDLTFVGFLTFLDRPKPGASDTIAGLGRLGVTVKLITGDSKRVAQHVAALVGLAHDRVLTGREMLALHDEALWHAAERTDLFVEVDPNQKERIIIALKKMSHVVGFSAMASTMRRPCMPPTRVCRSTMPWTLLERRPISCCWSGTSTGSEEGSKKGERPSPIR
jgi:Mg2+-importing ATPase